MLNGDIWPYANLFHNMTGSNDYDNFMNTNAPASFGYYTQYLNQPSVRKMIHVGDKPFPNNPRQCELHLLADFMVDFKDDCVFYFMRRVDPCSVCVTW
jgi:vitellogenic carboxypeptidase-like protein|eukprot:SAG25_NODE_1553_length_2774_cov_3.969720_3_plen_98_part_00